MGADVGSTWKSNKHKLHPNKPSHLSFFAYALRQLQALYAFYE